MQMDECIDTLLFLQQSAEDQYMTKHLKIGFRHNLRYDAEMQLLARVYSKFACDLVEPEYDYSIATSTTYSYEINNIGEHVYDVQSVATPELYVVRELSRMIEQEHVQTCC